MTSKALLQYIDGYTELNVNDDNLHFSLSNINCI